jgi:hypothetical protein
LLLLGLDLTVQWNDSSADASINAAAEALIDQGTKAAKRRCLFHEFVYLNYALPSQDPIAGYGKENQSKLRRISRQHDPAQAFQRLVPGGFKLYR